jgi:hypothetical protein
MPWRTELPDYLTAIYGDSLNIPTQEEVRTRSANMLPTPHNARSTTNNSPMNRNNLLPGEDITTVDGKTSVSGQVAVMGINNIC